MRIISRFSLTVAAAAAGLAGLGALPATATASTSQPGFQFDWDLPPEAGVIEIDPCILPGVECGDPEPEKPTLPWHLLCKFTKLCDDGVDTDGNPDGNPGDDPDGDPGDDPGEDPGDDPGEDPGEDPGDDPTGNPGDDPEPCELDEVCTRTPTFTG